jgi:hypothetical protein
MGFEENWTVGCIATGCLGIDDAAGRFVDDGNVSDIFFRLLSNVNDCVLPARNSNSSVDDDVVIVGIVAAGDDMTCSLTDSSVTAQSSSVDCTLDCGRSID